MMKTVGKYILLCLGVAVLTFCFAAFFPQIFNGLSRQEGISLGVGIFLSVEMVICTGVLLHRLHR